jgi:hypothetical protein
MGTNDWVSKPQVEKSPAEATEPASLAGQPVGAWRFRVSTKHIRVGASAPQEDRVRILGVPLPTGREIKECLLEFRC